MGKRPVVAEREVAEWCRATLGSAPVESLFDGGYLSLVLGLQLADGREVVVKIRENSPRLEGCALVHRRLFDAGFPCPEPLSGVAPITSRLTASAEALVRADQQLPDSGRGAVPFAEAFARLLALAPPPSDVPDLWPPLPWTGWNHEEGRLWPWPDDKDVDLNNVAGPAWVDDAGRRARDRLRAAVGAQGVGHGDWYAGNIRWSGNVLAVVHDWDSVIIDSEAAMVGFAAAVFPTTHAGDEDPVAAFVADLAAETIGESEVVLDCERNEVRGVESNCGNLIADGLLSTARQRAADFGVDAPQVAVQNGGGIRGEIDQPAGPISVADTFRLAPFGNFVAVAEDVPAETFRQIIEEGAILLPTPGDGGFVHLAGATVVIDPSFPARVANQTTGEQLTPGQRVRSLVLDDGTVVVAGGVTQDVTLDIAGLNFSFNGGDAYPAVPFTTVGATDQQSLQGYIEGPLGGLVTQAQYPRGGEGRITIVAS